MIGARCADLIAEAVVSMEFKASAEDISRMSHAHPTFAEAVKSCKQTDKNNTRIVSTILQKTRQIIFDGFFF
jgi:dihydrolipoamide dehydrogenase